jgi:hypothetical protein
MASQTRNVSWGVDRLPRCPEDQQLNAGQAWPGLRRGFRGETCPLLIILQVVRYTALLSGITYGIYHQSTLQKQHDADKASDPGQREVADGADLGSCRSSTSSSTGNT